MGGIADRHGHISPRQHRRVVHAIADHGHDRAFGLQRFDPGQFVRG